MTFFENIHIAQSAGHGFWPPVSLYGRLWIVSLYALAVEQNKLWFVSCRAPRNIKHNGFRHMPCKVILTPISQIAWFQNALAPKASRRGTPDRRRGTSDLDFERWAVGVVRQSGR